MKKLLLLVGFLFYSFNLLADIGDVYYCEIKSHRGIKLNWTTNKFEEFDSAKNKFKFKRTKDFIIFNKDSENAFNNLTLKVNQNKNSKDKFWATEDTNKHSIMTVLRYEVFEKQGLFVMTQNYGSRAWYAFANCEIF
tara:strand:- start:1435 stop:1845 length:411 start_codon:yes stop_codon:yes gene_type:complete